MKDAWSFFVVSMKDQASYRGAIVLYFFGGLFHIGVAILVWLNAQNTQFSGFTKPELLTYYLLFLVLDMVLGWYILHPVANQIIDGRVMSYILRPVSYLKAWIGMELSFKLIGVLIYGTGAGILAFVMLAYNVELAPLHLGIQNITLASLAGLCAVALTFLLNYSLGLLAFWFTEIQFVDYVYFTIIPFFSGELMPTTFLPPLLQTINQYLPFRYHMSFVLEILMNKVSGGEVVKGFCVALLWIVLYGFLTQWMWKRGTRAYMAFGQ